MTVETASVCGNIRGSQFVIDEISYFAVLKEGVHYGPHSGWGWKHIWEEELRTKRFRTYYLEECGLDLEGEALKQKILEDIEKTLRYGEKTYMPERQSVVFNYEGIEVVISIKPENSGSIITAHPGD